MHVAVRRPRVRDVCVRRIDTAGIGVAVHGGRWRPAVYGVGALASSRPIRLGAGRGGGTPQDVSAGGIRVEHFGALVLQRGDAGGRGWADLQGGTAGSEGEGGAGGGGDGFL